MPRCPICDNDIYCKNCDGPDGDPCSTCPDRERLRRIEEALEMFGDSNTSLDYVWEWVVDHATAKTHADALLAWAAARKGAAETFEQATQRMCVGSGSVPCPSHGKCVGPRRLKGGFSCAELVYQFGDEARKGAGRC